MSLVRPLLLGEGESDVGRSNAGEKRRPPCDFEGDLPRLLRRLSERAGGPAMFGYDAEIIRAIAARIPRGGRAMRTGGKAKELRNAVLAAIQTHSQVIALIDARTDELESLQRDAQEILSQCRERVPSACVAIGLAVQEIEIWMLADPEARAAAFGAVVGAQPVPDELESVANPKALWLERAGQGHAPSGAARCFMPTCNVARRGNRYALKWLREPVRKALRLSQKPSGRLYWRRKAGTPGWILSYACRGWQVRLPR